MEYKKNRRYFTTSPVLLYIGIALAALGTVAVILNGGSAMPYTIPTFITPGAVIIVIAYTLRSSEKSISDQIETKTQHFGDRIFEKFGISRTEYENLSPINLEYFDFIPENILIRRGKDMTYRSSGYVKAQIICTSTQIMIATLKFSLIEDADKEALISLPISSLSGCSVQKRTFTNETSKEKENFEADVFMLIGKSGGTEFEMTVHGIVSIEAYADELNELIRIENNN